MYPIKRVLSKLEKGDADVFCGGAKNADRERRFKFSKLPVYTVSYVLLMHSDDNYLASGYEQLKTDKVLIGAYFGTSSSRFLKNYGGLKVVDSFKSLDGAMEAIANKRIPYFYYHDLGLVHLVKGTKLPIKLMPTKLKSRNHWMLYSRQLDDDLVDKLELALTQISGEGLLDIINSQFF